MKTPIHLIDSASGPQTKPAAIPNISAPMTRCHSGILNQKDSILNIPVCLFSAAYRYDSVTASP
jgi:hypothetical protein